MSENEHFSKCFSLQFVSKLFLIAILCFPFSSQVFAQKEKPLAVSSPSDSLTAEELEELKRIEEDMIKSESVSRYDQPLNSVTVIGSRLPSFKVPFSNVPANLSYLPANITSEDKEQIYNAQPRHLPDSFKDLESVVLFDQVGSQVDQVFSLRGFTDSSSVIVLVDGVRVNKVDGNGVDFPLLSMGDLESIQVDRGSASPIFGTNAFAGAVHITTGKPSEKPMSLFGGFEYSSFNGTRWHNGVSGTIEDPTGGKFGYYFKGGRDQNRGWRDNSEYRITDFDVKTEYTLPEEDGRIFVHVKHVDDSISNSGSLTFQQFQDDPKQTKTDLDGRYMKNTILSLGADKKFADDHLLLSFLGSTRHNDIDFYTTFQTFTDFADGFNPDTNLVEVKERSNDFVVQLAYQDDWEAVHNQTVAGFEIRDQSNLSTQRDAFNGILQQTAIEADRRSDFNNFGIYWRESLDFNEAVIVHFGMRHDWHWLETNDFTTNTKISERWRDSTLSTGITGRPTKDIDIFFNYSQGFRVPTISEIAPFSGTVSQGLNPEKSDSYEVGTRVRIQDKAQLKASYFLIDLKDEILFDSTTRTNLAPFGQNANVAETRRTGIELRFDAKPIEEIELYGGYTWTQAWVRKSNPGGTFVNGRSLGQVPEHRFVMGTTLRPITRLCDGCGGFKVGLYGTVTGKQHPESFESNSQALLNATGGAGHYIKAYSIWDFILAYEWKNSEIYFKVNNLFDEDYYSRAVNATSFGTALQPAGTFTFVNPGFGREILFGSRWEFDTLTDLFTRGKSNSVYV